MKRNLTSGLLEANKTETKKVIDGLETLETAAFGMNDTAAQEAVNVLWKCWTIWTSPPPEDDPFAPECEAASA